MKVNIIKTLSIRGLIVAIMLMLICGMWLDGKNQLRLVPPSIVTNRVEFDRWSADKTILFHGSCLVQSQICFAIGLKQMAIVASGPPVYLFDSSGNLTDWSIDIGDAQSKILGIDYDIGGRPPVNPGDFRENVIYVSKRFD